MKSLFITGGRYDFSANLFTEEVPRRFIIGLVPNQNYIGHNQKNPFYFNHQQRTYPTVSRTIGITKTTGTLGRTMTPKSNLGMACTTESNGISYSMFKTAFCLYVFQMTNSQGDSPGFELIKEGCTAVNIRFAEAVPNKGGHTFDVWLKRYGQIIAQDGHALSDQSKVQLLIGKLGEAEYKRYIDSIAPKSQNDFNWDETTAKLKHLFGETRSLFLRRFDCFQIRQEAQQVRSKFDCTNQLVLRKCRSVAEQRGAQMHDSDHSIARRIHGFEAKMPSAPGRQSNERTVNLTARARRRVPQIPNPKGKRALPRLKSPAAPVPSEPNRSKFGTSRSPKRSHSKA
ncbi:hypothetical protein niasHT_005862 [Heterodera trifolii]|uniref:DUF7083 domain-containing protein n=1 Tax=Heterodera trifolii TaxID=157864 RepID=A0ABD2LS28_9BILA